MENGTEMEETPAAADAERIAVEQLQEAAGEAADEYKKVDGEM